jgi:signal peptidase I
MSSSTQQMTVPPGAKRRRLHLPSVPEAFTSFTITVVVALFVHTFILQPFLIPSESMEHTLLVGDFLLVNKQIYAPAGSRSNPARWIMPYRDVERGDIVVFHFPEDPRKFVVKRVVGVPGDRIRITNGRVSVNGEPLSEPYVANELAAPSDFRDNFPTTTYTDPNIDPAWWRVLQGDMRASELLVPPDKYFVLGDNRNYSDDSRYWGFVSRQAILARPLVIYFSLRRPSTTDRQMASDDKLGHDGEFSARLAGFARWNRIFQVVR